MRRNVTLKDIADKLGVSSVTVSKALNDREGVSDELREKIKETAKEMGYRVNAVARSMREGLSYNLGVIIPERFVDLSQSFYLQMYQHLSMRLEEFSYSAILHLLTDKDEQENRLPRIYYEKKVDGFIILGQPKKNYLEKIKSIDLPLLFLDFYDEHDDIDAVITDNFFGSYKITNYLIHKGHREIGFVGNLYEASTSSIQDRFLGYFKSLLEHNILLNEDFIINDRDEKGKFINLKLPNKLPTAFVANCDQVASNLIKTLNDLGFKVPDDCSIVSFDNDVFATISEPNLTTVAVDIEEMARTSARFIIEKVKDNNINFGRVSIEGKIIFRESVKSLS